MNQENTLKLWNKYPKIFQGKDKSIQESLIPFGFENGDGWYNIIDRLCEKIVATGEDIEALQVKEKYGRLCFYIIGGSDEVYKLIDEAEKESIRTCEVCGDPAIKQTDRGYWIYTRCQQHQP